MFLIFEGFQVQTVLILFLFSMIHFYLLTEKITTDVSNSNVYMPCKSYPILLMLDAIFGV